MKVLSILQPWATLVIIGAKKIETRSWATKHSGPLLIHASNAWSEKLNDIACSEPFYKHLSQHGFVGGRTKHKCGLPLGQIIGRVDLIKPVRTIDLLKGAGKPILLNLPYIILTDEEYRFGDYSAGRYGWILSNPVKFDNPLPARGNLGLWNFSLPTGPMT